MDPRYQMRTYLDILSEQDAIPTKQEYHQYVQNFNAGNYTIDYAVRGLIAGTDESVVTIEYWEAAKENNREMAMWRDSWKPQLSDQEIDILLKALEARDPYGGYARDDDDEDADHWETVFMNVLKQHISNPDLFQKNDAIWEDIMFSADEGKSYEEFVEDAKERGIF